MTMVVRVCTKPYHAICFVLKTVRLSEANALKNYEVRDA